MIDTINRLAREAFSSGATDLFLCEDSIPRIRVNGDVRVPGATALTRDDMVELWQNCGADPDTQHEHDSSYVIPEGSRLRVNFYKSMGQLAAVLRPIKDEIPTLEELGAPSALITDWFSRKSGLVLITGPTGSGKSTTLAAGLQWINEHYARHIVTIEDPIEYLFANAQSYFSQRELHADTPSFASALRASLRQSPDIILLGEIRDSETAQIALQAAETGHLVLATLHSSSVVDSLERLGNLFGSEQQDGLLKLLSQHLIGILCQRLIPRTGGGMLLAIEHLQNEAATRKWIRANDLPHIADHINRTDNPANCSFVRFLAAATQQGYLDEAVARKNAPNAQDFDRLIRGIS